MENTNIENMEERIENETLSNEEVNETSENQTVEETEKPEHHTFIDTVVETINDLSDKVLHAVEHFIDMDSYNIPLNEEDDDEEEIAENEGTEQNKD